MVKIVIFGCLIFQILMLSLLHAKCILLIFIIRYLLGNFLPLLLTLFYLYIFFLYFVVKIRRFLLLYIFGFWQNRVYFLWILLSFLCMFYFHLRWEAFQELLFICWSYDYIWTSQNKFMVKLVLQIKSLHALYLTLEGHLLMKLILITNRLLLKLFQLTTPLIFLIDFLLVIKLLLPKVYFILLTFKYNIHSILFILSLKLLHFHTHSFFV